MSRLSIVMLFIASCVIFSHKAQAACVDYMDMGSVPCSSPDGTCEGSYEMITCTLGCVSGTCNPGGNSGNCCGTVFSYAQIFPDGQGNCNGYECGGISRLFPRKKQKWLNARTRKKIPPYADVLTYKPPRLVFIPDSCNHTYSVFLQDYSQLSSVGGN